MTAIQEAAQAQGFWPSYDAGWSASNTSRSRIGTCQYFDCKRKYFARGLCALHYDRFRRAFGPPPPITLEQRMIAARAIAANGCWEWQKHIGAGGYGQITISQRSLKVHRVAAMLWLGFDLESPLDVCHKCDNPRCYNPDHLFFGTAKDNMLDASRKGRFGNRKGENGSFAKLKNRQVKHIRRLRNKGLTYREIAARYGMGISAIQSICSGKSWTNLLPPTT